MNKWLRILWLLLFSICVSVANAQTKSKEINKQSQVWVSLNTTAKLTGKWGLLIDLHERRNNFLKDPSFHFVRLGINYWLKDNITFSIGCAHLWLAPTVTGWKTFSNENRIYQQAQMISKIGKVSMLQRLRNEQRWQQKIVNDKATGQNKFTNRLRYLLSCTILFFKNPFYPSLVISDEQSVQFGKEVVYNTFDQNRFFIGIKQKITKEINFDLGYMQVKQQKSSGYQFDLNYTLRCFFNYTPGCRTKKHMIIR